MNSSTESIFLNGIYGTALQAAVYRKNFQIVHLLLEAGAAMNILGKSLALHQIVILIA